MDDLEIDSPEMHQREALNREVASPETENLNHEAPASEVAALPDLTTTIPVAPAANFDPKTEILGLKDIDLLTVSGIALQTKEILSKEPKVKMMIPLDPGEKAGAYRTVSINGYRFDVRKNTMIDLPQSVAQLIADAYRITSETLDSNPRNLAMAGEEKRRALGI